MTTDRTTPEQLEWERTCSRHITSDVIWRLDAYRASLFLLNCVQLDLETIRAREHVKDQLIRAAGDVASHLGEGYSRSTRADRVRYYGYCLGSIRECLAWYLGLRDQLDAKTLDDRLALISRCRALLLGMINSSRTNRPPRPGTFEE